MSTWGGSVGHVEPTLIGYFPGTECRDGGLHVCAVYVSGSGFSLLRMSGPTIPPETPTVVCGCNS